MKKEITAVLKDIYEVAPDLREREAEIITLIDELLKNRPEQKIDTEFRDELRSRLLAEFGDAPKKAGFIWPTWSRYALSATAGGAVVAVVIMLTASVSGLPGPRQARDAKLSSTADESGYTMFKLADRAFGSLAGGEAQRPDSPMAALDADESTALAPTPTSVSIGAAKAGGGQPSTTPKPELISIMPFQPVRNEYVYDEPIQLTGSSVTVVKAVNDLDVSSLNRSVASGMLGPIDLGAFDDLQIDSLSASEDREWGYSVNLNTHEGAVHLNRNWQRWPNERDFADSRKQLTEADVPTDEELIAVAENFMEDFGISRSDYGRPTISSDWRIGYAKQTAAGMRAWVPDEHMVTFPLIVDERPVVDDNGNPQGLNVSVNIRYGRISHAGPVYVQKYLTSSYPALSDESRLKEALAKGGINAWQDPNAETTARRELNPPAEVMLMRHVWNGDESQRLFIPALMFEVKDRDEQVTDGQWIPRAIVLPLADEFYDQATSPGIPEPMPLMDPPRPGAATTDNE